LRREEVTLIVIHARPVEFVIIHGARADGAVIGSIDGCDIVEFVLDEFGRRYEYAGLASRRWNGKFDVDVLGVGEFILQPGLVYRIVKPSARHVSRLFG
jgi:hypothetical protein